MVMSVYFQGTIVVQPEDATDSPFQGPEFFPPDSSDSGEFLAFFLTVRPESGIVNFCYHLKGLIRYRIKCCHVY